MIPNVSKVAGAGGPPGSVASGTDATRPAEAFPRVGPEPVESGVRQGSDAIGAGGVLAEVNRPFAELDRLEREVVQRLEALPSPPDVTDVASMRREMMRMLLVQMRVSRAALAVQLSAKAVEMTTAGINTLARTQT